MDSDQVRARLVNMSTRYGEKLADEHADRGSALEGILDEIDQLTNDMMEDK